MPVMLFNKRSKKSVECQKSDVVLWAQKGYLPIDKDYNPDVKIVKGKTEQRRIGRPTKDDKSKD